MPPEGQQFDASVFESQQFNDANDTRYVAIPEGEYLALIKEKKFRQEKGYTILDVTWLIDDAGVKEATGMKEPTVRQSIFLDVTQSGGLDFGKGKNVRLGRLREATGLNTPGQPFSFNMLEGRPARISVKHRLHDGETYSDVKEVTKA
jgi:hypothetical protein